MQMDYLTTNRNTRTPIIHSQIKNGTFLWSTDRQKSNESKEIFRKRVLTLPDIPLQRRERKTNIRKEGSTNKTKQNKKQTKEKKKKNLINDNIK